MIVLIISDDLKFGVLISFKHLAHDGWETVKSLTLKLERLGYHTVWLGDHFAKGGYRLESWTALSALSTITSTIRLGPLVLCNSFRIPSLVAKMAATLDVISGGRLEFGIGAGFHWPEYDAYGVPFPKLSVRTAQLNEALEIITRMWTEEKPSYTGKYYQIREAVCEPKPIQKPHPPITIGGGNEKYTLKLVAKYADRWDFSLPVEIYKLKLDALKKHCSRIGRDFREVEKSCFFTNVGVYSNERELMKSMNRIYKMEGRRVYDRMEGTIPFVDWLNEVRVRSIIGTRDECIERIKEYMKAGVTNFILRFVESAKKADLPLKRFKEEVIDSLTK